MTALVNKGPATKLTAALISLMAGKEYDKITVADIAAKAGLGRATFYRYFKNKDEVIRSFLQTITHGWNASKPEAAFTRNYPDIRAYHVEVFKHLARYRKLCRVLHGAKAMRFLEEEFYRALRANDPDENKRYQHRALAASLLSVFIEYSFDDAGRTPEEVADLVLGTGVTAEGAVQKPAVEAENRY